MGRSADFHSSVGCGCCVEVIDISERYVVTVFDRFSRMIKVVLIVMLLWINEYSYCNACPTTNTFFGWIGSSPVLNYTTNVAVDGTVKLSSPNKSSLFAVTYIAGTVFKQPVYNDCSLAPGGNIGAGVLNIQLNPLQIGQQGIYQYEHATVVMKCIDVFIYGPPTQPTIGSNASIAYEGQSAVLTCSSTSTTVPSGHNLIMAYEWRRDGNTVSTGGRFTLEPTTGRTLTITNINRNDDMYSFSCRATEQGGNSSLLSDGYRLTVGYGPDSVTLSPSNTSYTLNENQPLNDISCSASCYPACIYNWTWSGGGIVSNTGVLSLGTLQRGEAGTYWCTASNAARSMKSQNININVNYGPDSVTLTPSTTSYTLNETRPLNDISCSASCYPACTYMWTKSGGGTVSNTGVLSLGTLQRGEAGTYWCTASNAAASRNSQNVTINVNYGPDVVTLSPSTASYTLNEAQPLNDITCSADCYPACNYMWTRSGGATVSNTGVLSLGTLLRGEADTYWCTARNAAGSMNSQTVTINVIYGPDSVTLSPSTTSYTLNENQPLNDITCSASCYPACNYNWTKSGGGTVSNTGVLSLETLQRGEAGTYRCTASNAEADVSKTTQNVTINIRYGPDFVSISVQLEHTVNEGQQSPNVTCTADCWPECTYKWRNMTSGSDITNTRVLALGQVSRYAAGIYTCTARNTDYNQIKENSTRLIVNYFPDVALSKSTLSSNEGQPLDLICVASGIPAVYTFTPLTQKFGEVQIPNSHISHGSTTSQSTHTVHIPALQLQDTGTYTCHAQNGVQDISGNLVQTASTLVMVNVSPKVLTNNVKSAAATGANVTFNIPFYSYPAVEEMLIQRHDGLNISSSTVKYSLINTNATVKTDFYGAKVQLEGTMLNFTVTFLQPNDFGNYTLQMRNSVNVTTVYLNLVAESKPSPSENLNHTVVENTVYFTWKQGFNGGHTQTFIVQLSTDSTDNFFNHTTIMEDSTSLRNGLYSVNISNLDAGIYHARLLIYNDIGAAEVQAFGDFEIKKDKEPSPVPVALVGGVAGGLAAVIAVGVILIILWKKRQWTGLKGDSDRLTDGRKMNDVHKNKVTKIDDSGDLEVENMMYVPAGDISRPTPSDVYSTVNKTKPAEASKDVYAMVDKKAKEKKKKKKDVYENPPSGSTKKTYDNKAFEENPYENNESASNRKNVSPDGLVYADLDFPNQPKGQKRLVIHGLDDRTEYAEVDLTRKADPLPDSDSEDKKNDKKPTT